MQAPAAEPGQQCSLVQAGREPGDEVDRGRVRADQDPAPVAGHAGQDLAGGSLGGGPGRPVEAAPRVLGAAEGGGGGVINLVSKQARLGEAAFERLVSLDLGDLMNERGSGMMATYARSKLANLLFMQALAQRLAGSAVTALPPPCAT